MATIKEVARLAGVSPTTASYALNNRPEVKEATREKVHLAAKQLCYVPNRLAQSMRNGKSNTIMVITSENIECGNTFSSEFLGILSGARYFNYDVLVKLVDPQHTDEGELERLLGSFSDGYLLLGNHLDNIAYALAERARKCVMLSSHSDAPVCQVNSDGRTWIRRMTEFVFAHGRTKPAYFSYEIVTEEERLRYQGYREAMSGAMTALEPTAFCCGMDDEKLKMQLKQAISDGYDSVVCWNDVLAVQVVEALSVMGYRVPDQIAVTGFDDNLSYSDSVYHLTTVRQEFRLKGETAIRELVSQIDEDKAVEAGDLFVDCSIIERGTL